MALANIIKEVDPPVELTQAEYNALSTAQKNDGTVYYITDGNGAFQTAATTPAEDTSGGDSNVQAELNKKVAKTDIVNNFTTTQAGYAADARALKTIADNYSLKTDLANYVEDTITAVTPTVPSAASTYWVGDSLAYIYICGKIAILAVEGSLDVTKLPTDGTWVTLLSFPTAKSKSTVGFMETDFFYKSTAPSSRHYQMRITTSGTLQLYCNNWYSSITNNFRIRLLRAYPLA